MKCMCTVQYNIHNKYLDILKQVVDTDANDDQWYTHIHTETSRHAKKGDVKGWQQNFHNHEFT